MDTQSSRTSKTGMDVYYWHWLYILFNIVRDFDMECYPILKDLHFANIEQK